MAADSTEDVFFAEKVVDSGLGQQDGKRYYKVKWTRYTWEQEESISIKLKELLDEFWNEHGGNPTISKEKPSNGNKKKIVKEDNGSMSQTNITSQDEQISAVSIITSPSRIEDLTNVQNIPDIHKSITGDNKTSEIPTTSHHENDDRLADMKIDKHTCDVCARTYSSAQALKTHRKTHQPDRSFKCEICLKCFSERSTLKRHMFIHLDEKPFKCDHCERGFSDKSTLRRHIITHTGSKRFVCERCGKRFTRNEHLRQHMYIHTAEKLYKCEICNKPFRQRSTWKNHMLRHRAEIGFKCETCGDVFNKQTLYDKHVLWCSENAERRVECSECKKLFPNEATLKLHLEDAHTQNAIKPYKCEQCGKVFVRRSSLQQHFLTHTTQSKHHCHICQKKFTRKDSLASHIDSQHSNTAAETTATIEEQATVFGIMQPVPYIHSDSITLNPETLDQHVQFVIHNSTDSSDMSDTPINTVEVSSHNITTNDDVSILPHGVCNVSSDVLRTPTVDTEPLNLDEKMSSVGTSDNKSNSTQQSSTPSRVQIQLGQDGTLQPGENQLLQVQIIRMEDGNQFVQSIQAIVQGDEKEYGEPDLVVDESHVMNINDANMVTDTTISVSSSNASNCFSTSSMDTISSTPFTSDSSTPQLAANINPSSLSFPTSDVQNNDETERELHSIVMESFEESATKDILQ